MSKYENGKIYKIVCNKTGEQYIGSTYGKLANRKSGLKYLYKKYLNEEVQYINVFKIIERGDYDMILIEKYPCNSKEELILRKMHYIKTMKCINAYKKEISKYDF